MAGLKIFLYVFLIFIIVILSIFFLVVATLRYPNDCKYGCDRAPKYMNGPNCLSVKEIFLDPTIPIPTPNIYLSKFYKSEGSGPPLCSPMWYAFRYVRNRDGAYGPLSKWSGSDSANLKDQNFAFAREIPLPIYSGSDNLPCLPPGCENNQIPYGSETCSFNQIALSILGKLDLDTRYGDPDAGQNGYTLNVHRQVGIIRNGVITGFNPDGEGEIVGSFLILPESKKNITGTFFDIQNPNVTNRSTCCN